MRSSRTAARSTRSVRFYAHGPRHAFYLTPERVVLSFLDESNDRGVTLDLRFPGSRPRGALEGVERASGEVNYLRGSDPAGWRTAIPRYTEVAYRGLWAGIDLGLAEVPGTLKYEFRLRPGAQVSDVRLEYRGARGLSVDPSGALLIDTPLGVLRDSAPESYQIIDGERVAVGSRYVLHDTGAALPQIGFAVDAYRPDCQLVIDPGIQYLDLPRRIQPRARRGHQG